MNRVLLLISLASVLVAPVTFGESVTTAAAELEAPNRTKSLTPPLDVQDFTLLDQDGKEFAFSDMRGTPLLVFFGFTNCPNVCPPTMQKLRQVQRRLTEDDLSPICIFVSVDGERDTPEVMKKYLEPFMPGFIGLTGDPRRVRDIATGFSAVFFKGMPTDTLGGYNVEHTSQVYLVDQRGRLRASFYNASAKDMIETTRRVVTEAE